MSIGQPTHPNKFLFLSNESSVPGLTMADVGGYFDDHLDLSDSSVNKLVFSDSEGLRYVLRKEANQFILLHGNNRGTVDSATGVVSSLPGFEGKNISDLTLTGDSKENFRVATLMDKVLDAYDKRDQHAIDELLGASNTFIIDQEDIDAYKKDLATAKKLFNAENDTVLNEVKSYLLTVSQQQQSTPENTATQNSIQTTQKEVISSVPSGTEQLTPTQKVAEINSQLGGEYVILDRSGFLRKIDTKNSLGYDTFSFARIDDSIEDIKRELKIVDDNAPKSSSSQEKDSPKPKQTTSTVEKSTEPKNLPPSQKKSASTPTIPKPTQKKNVNAEENDLATPTTEAGGSVQSSLESLDFANSRELTSDGDTSLDESMKSIKMIKSIKRLSAYFESAKKIRNKDTSLKYLWKVFDGDFLDGDNLNTSNVKKLMGYIMGGESIGKSRKSIKSDVDTLLGMQNIGDYKRIEKLSVALHGGQDPILENFMRQLALVDYDFSALLAKFDSKVVDWEGSEYRKQTTRSEKKIDRKDENDALKNFVSKHQFISLRDAYTAQNLLSASDRDPLLKQKTGLQRVAFLLSDLNHDGQLTYADQHNKLGIQLRDMFDRRYESGTLTESFHNLLKIADARQGSDSSLFDTYNEDPTKLLTRWEDYLVVQEVLKAPMGNLDAMLDHGVGYLADDFAAYSKEMLKYEEVAKDHAMAEFARIGIENPSLEQVQAAAQTLVDTAKGVKAAGISAGVPLDDIVRGLSFTMGVSSSLKDAENVGGLIGISYNRSFDLGGDGKKRLHAGVGGNVIGNDILAIFADDRDPSTMLSINSTTSFDFLINNKKLTKTLDLTSAKRLRVGMFSTRQPKKGHISLSVGAGYSTDRLEGLERIASSLEGSLGSVVSSIFSSDESDLETAVHSALKEQYGKTSEAELASATKNLTGILRQMGSEKYLGHEDGINYSTFVTERLSKRYAQARRNTSVDSMINQWYLSDVNVAVKVFSINIKNLEAPSGYPVTAGAGVKRHRKIGSGELLNSTRERTFDQKEAQNRLSDHNIERDYTTGLLKFAVSRAADGSFSIRLRGYRDSDGNLYFPANTLIRYVDDSDHAKYAGESKLIIGGSDSEVDVNSFGSYDDYVKDHTQSVDALSSDPNAIKKVSEDQYNQYKDTLYSGYRVIGEEAETTSSAEVSGSADDLFAVPDGADDPFANGAESSVTTQATERIDLCDCSDISKKMQSHTIKANPYAFAQAAAGGMVGSPHTAAFLKSFGSFAATVGVDSGYSDLLNLAKRSIDEVQTKHNNVAQNTKNWYDGLKQILQDAFDESNLTNHVDPHFYNALSHFAGLFSTTTGNRRNKDSSEYSVYYGGTSQNSVDKLLNHRLDNMPTYVQEELGLDDTELATYKTFLKKSLGSIKAPYEAVQHDGITLVMSQGRVHGTGDIYEKIIDKAILVKDSVTSLSELDSSVYDKLKKYYIKNLLDLGPHGPLSVIYNTIGKKCGSLGDQSSCFDLVQRLLTDGSVTVGSDTYRLNGGHGVELSVGLYANCANESLLTSSLNFDRVISTTTQGGENNNPGSQSLDNGGGNGINSTGTTTRNTFVVLQKIETKDEVIKDENALRYVEVSSDVTSAAVVATDHRTVGVGLGGESEREEDGRNHGKGGSNPLDDGEPDTGGGKTGADSNPTDGNGGDGGNGTTDST